MDIITITIGIGSFLTGGIIAWVWAESVFKGPILLEKAKQELLSLKAQTIKSEIEVDKLSQKRNKYLYELTWDDVDDVPTPNNVNLLDRTIDRTIVTNAFRDSFKALQALQEVPLRECSKIDAYSERYRDKAFICFREGSIHPVFSLYYKEITNDWCIKTAPFNDKEGISILSLDVIGYLRDYKITKIAYYDKPQTTK